MTSEVDIANRALSSIGTRSQIVALNEDSNEARACNLLIDPLRDELLRLAPWGCCRNFKNLSLICAAPGTPENPTQVATAWQKGIPAPPWAYEYEYPSDCTRAIFIVPQFMTGVSAGIPITTAVTGGVPSFWNGPPVKFQIAIDQIDQSTGLPANTGVDTKIILTNQESAILCYNKRITDPTIMDDQFQQAWVAALAGRLVMALIGDKSLANLKINEANSFIAIARASDGNEGLTINNVTPDWIRARGIEYQLDSWSPYAQYDWGNFLSMY